MQTMTSFIKDTFALLVALTLMPPILLILGVWMFADWLDLKLQKWSKQ